MSNQRLTTAQLASVFAALGNPHRLALFQRLATCCAPGTRCSVDEATRIGITDLSADLDIAPSTFAHHLRTLRNAGLVQTERRGKRVECWVEPDALVALSAFFAAPLSLDPATVDPDTADPQGDPVAATGDPHHG